MHNQHKHFLYLIILFSCSLSNAMESEDKKAKGLATEALGAAVVSGNIKGVKKALKNKADVDGLYTKIDNSLFGGIRTTRPLMVFALCLWPDGKAHTILKLLLAHKADSNKRDDTNRTPLHWAVTKGRLNCIALLLENGAEVNALDNDGDTALHYAVRVGYIHNKTRLEPLDTQPIQLLLNAGADPTLRNKIGYTPLHTAACRGRHEFFGQLITFVPVKDILKAKREAATVLLKCFKKFQKGDPFKVQIPKDIQRMLCNYCTPGIVLETLVENKIELLQKWFALQVQEYTIGDIARSKLVPVLAYNARYEKVQELTDVNKVEQHKPVIREHIKKLLCQTPLWPNKEVKSEK